MASRIFLNVPSPSYLLCISPNYVPDCSRAHSLACFLFSIYTTSPTDLTSLMDLDDIAMPITPECPPLANSPLENSTLVYATDYLVFPHGHQRSISNLKPKVELQYSPQSVYHPVFLISVNSTNTLPVLKSKPSE